MLKRKFRLFAIGIVISLTLISVTHFYSQLYSKFNQIEDCPSESLTVSICSCRAYRRGLRQNVIALSLYGNLIDPDLQSRFVDPLKVIINRVRQVYPDWTVRIYSPWKNNPEDLNTNKMLKNTFELYDNVDLCNATRAMEYLKLNPVKVFPMVWRFLPLLDPFVDQFMSRDADGVLLDREIQAVYEWLRSSAIFHIMRDHPWHCITMLGGTWGAKTYLNRGAISKAALNLFNDHIEPNQAMNGIDQDLINRHIWPLTKKDLMSHDSYCCGRFSDTGDRPFPIRRISNEYVGEMLIAHNKSSNPLPQVCPVKCRPPEHADWTYC